MEGPTALQAKQRPEQFQVSLLESVRTAHLTVCIGRSFATLGSVKTPTYLNFSKRW